MALKHTGGKHRRICYAYICLLYIYIEVSFSSLFDEAEHLEGKRGSFYFA